MTKSHLPFILHFSFFAEDFHDAEYVIANSGFPLGCRGTRVTNASTRIDNRLSPPGARTALKKRTEAQGIVLHSTGQRDIQAATIIECGDRNVDAIIEWRLFLSLLTRAFIRR
jgi:hypothetical protein